MESTNQQQSTELIPLMFQLREYVPQSDRAGHLGRTQSSCGGEDTYENT